MNNKAPKLKLIQGGKTNQPKVKLSMGLFLVFGIILLYLLVLIYGV
jgi:hypothetical protein